MNATRKGAITYYQGYRFRSKLEAQWMFIFKHLGVDVVYEPETYWLSNGEGYQPDFLIEGDGGLLHVIEVKPIFSAVNQEELDKVSQFAREGHKYHGTEISGVYITPDLNIETVDAIELLDSLLPHSIEDINRVVRAAKEEVFEFGKETPVITAEINNLEDYSISDITGGYNFSLNKEESFTATEVAKELGLSSAQKMNNLLLECGFLIKTQSRAMRVTNPKHLLFNKNHAVVYLFSTTSHIDDNSWETPQFRWTKEGMDFLREKWNGTNFNL